MIEQSSTQVSERVVSPTTTSAASALATSAEPPVFAWDSRSSISFSRTTISSAGCRLRPVGASSPASMICDSASSAIRAPVYTRLLRRFMINSLKFIVHPILSFSTSLPHPRPQRKDFRAQRLPNSPAQPPIVGKWQIPCSASSPQISPSKKPAKKGRRNYESIDRHLHHHRYSPTARTILFYLKSAKNKKSSPSLKNIMRSHCTF